MKTTSTFIEKNYEWECHMKKTYKLFVLILMLTLTACHSESAEKPVYYSSVDTAIEHGLIDEGISKEHILSKHIQSKQALSKKEIEHVVIAFFVSSSNNAVSAATLTEQPEGWRWYRSIPFYGFDGESPLMYASVKTMTENGEEILLLLGKANDPEITEVQLKNKRTNQVRSIPIFNLEDEKYFFEIINSELNDIELSEIRTK